MPTSWLRTKRGSLPGSWHSAWSGRRESHRAAARGGREPDRACAFSRGAVALPELGSRGPTTITLECPDLRRAHLLHRVRGPGPGPAVAGQARSALGSQRARPSAAEWHRRILAGAIATAAVGV